MTPDEIREVRNAILLALTITVWALVFGLWICPPAKADCLVHVSAPAWCVPCRQMAPQVSAAKASGVDIREVDYDKSKPWAAMCRVVPTTFYVRETVAGNYVLGRLEGFATVDQLRSLALAPRIAVVDGIIANAIRSVLAPPPCVIYVQPVGPVLR